MLASGSIFEDRYRIDKVIGKGGMGKVYLAYDIVDNSRWAIKEQVVTDKNRKLLMSEAEIMSKLHHPALPALRLQKEIGDKLYLVMEYIDGRTLDSIIRKEGPAEESRVVDWFTQVCEILVYLHGLETPIVYRDLKPSNIMLEDSGRVRIIDFGIAQEYGREVFAFPGNINQEYSEGCNNLIRKNGATLITSAKDFAESMGWLDDRRLERAQKEGIERQMFPDLSPDQQRIVETLQKTNDLQVNMLSNMTGLSVGKVAAEMFELEMKGVARSLPGSVCHLL